MDESNNLYDRLINLSIEDYYNPYDYFKWPESLPQDSYWMSEELISIYGLPVFDQLSRENKILLSKWEVINLFSITFHGEQEIKCDTVHYVESPKDRLTGEYLHYFLREENSHMFFFSKFCKKYAGKIYETRKLKLSSFDNPDIEKFVVFAQALIAEEIVDTFNVAMMQDNNLPDIIREISKRHHIDESRHLAMGKQLLPQLWDKVITSSTQERIQEIRLYLEKTISHFLNSFYNANVYKDAGIDDPLEVRKSALNSDIVVKKQEQITNRLRKYLVGKGILVS